MEKYLTASEARQRFLQLVDEVIQGEQIVVTKHGVPAAVLIGAERLATLKSLAGLWQDPEALRAMQAAHADVKAGRVLRTHKVPRVRELVKLARAQGLVRG